MLKKLQIESGESFVWTIVFSFMGVVAFILVSLLPRPDLAMGMLEFGLIPTLSVIAVVGAIRGPLAGFLTGFFGDVVFNLARYGIVADGGLLAVAYGVLGLVVGLASYDLAKGRSLGKLSVLSAIGFAFTLLLVTVFDIAVGGVSPLAVIGFVTLPLVTMGLPTVILLTPVLAWLYNSFMSAVIPPS